MWWPGRAIDSDPFAEFDGRAPRRRAADPESEAPIAGLFAAGGALQRRVASASANWHNDPRRWVRLALMIYLGISLFVLMSILRANRRMPLMSSVVFVLLMVVVSVRVRQMLAYHRRLTEGHDRERREAMLRHVIRSRPAHLAALSPHQLGLMTRELNANDYDVLSALDQEAPPHRGMEQSLINRLPSYRVEQGSKEISCAICLEMLVPSDTARILPCLHQFHKDCIDKWLLDAAACPVCKMQVDVGGEVAPFARPAPSSPASALASSSQAGPRWDYGHDAPAHLHGPGNA
eukprot:Tamp_18527.p1 GENE.Tamp_18527~~Tamp_18527.p1  ORF type:complete len:291 (+),score=51.50 Tamp_18527:3-875(+)